MEFTALDNPKCIDFANTEFQGNAYVYVWVDENLCPFYVGSGTDNRGYYSYGHSNRLGLSEKTNPACGVYLVAKNVNRHIAYMLEMYTIRYYVWSKIELAQTVHTHNVYEEEKGAITDAFRETWDYILFKHYEYVRDTQGCDATAFNIRSMVIEAENRRLEREYYQRMVQRYQEIRAQVECGLMSISDACRELNISVGTWYRRKKQFWWQAE